MKIKKNREPTTTNNKNKQQEIKIETNRPWWYSTKSLRQREDYRKEKKRKERKNISL